MFIIACSYGNHSHSTWRRLTPPIISCNFSLFKNSKSTDCSASCFITFVSICWQLLYNQWVDYWVLLQANEMDFQCISCAKPRHLPLVTFAMLKLSNRALLYAHRFQYVGKFVKIVSKFWNNRSFTQVQLLKFSLGPIDPAGTNTVACIISCTFPES